METDIPKEIPKPSVQPRNDRPPRRPKKFVKYEVIGENNVAVPTHLFKVKFISVSPAAISSPEHIKWYRKFFSNQFYLLDINSTILMLCKDFLLGKNINFFIL